MEPLVEEPFRPIFEPIRFPCGREIRNRFVKVALYEHGAPMWGGDPNAYHRAIYSEWSRGQWGMIISGNIQVSPTHLTLGRDMVIPTTITQESIEQYKRLADVIHGLSGKYSIEGEEHWTLAIMQLSHGGRQSPALIGGRRLWDPPLAPSSVRLGNESAKAEGMLSHHLHRILFPTPKEMTLEDINDVLELFVNGARVAMESGFDGIQLHAAHGYLLSEFVSLKHNKRQDEYSAIVSPLKLIHQIVTRIREIAPKNFVIGVKLNAADYNDSHIEDQAIADTKQNQEDRALSHVQEIASWGMMDFIEISGGDYENPDFVATSRQALFSQFSRRAMKSLSGDNSALRSTPLVLLTGNLCSASTFTSVLAENHAHLLGIGRLSIRCPDLPLQIKVQGSKFVAPPGPDFSESNLDRLIAFLGKITGIKFPRLIGAGKEVGWYNVQLRRVAQGRELDYSVGALGSIVKMWFWRVPSRIMAEQEALRNCVGRQIEAVPTSE